MAQIIVENCCAACGHQVVFGVACDWQPEICPFSKKTTSQQESSKLYHPAPAVMPVMPEEYDAILSNN